MVNFFSTNVKIEDKIKAGVELISTLKRKKYNISEILNIIEIITRVPEIKKEILTEAERRGIIKRAEKYITIMMHDNNKHLKIKRERCSANCIRCGREIKNCYFVLVGSFKFGPFGSECIKKTNIF